MPSKAGAGEGGGLRAAGDVAFKPKFLNLFNDVVHKQIKLSESNVYVCLLDEKMNLSCPNLSHRVRHMAMQSLRLSEVDLCEIFKTSPFA